MKKNPFVLCAILVSWFAAFQVFGEESDKSDAAPPEAVIGSSGP